MVNICTKIKSRKRPKYDQALYWELEMPFVGPLSIGLGSFSNMLVPHMCVIRAMQQNERPDIFIFAKISAYFPRISELPMHQIAPNF
jgi:hypothetical protein